MGEYYAIYAIIVIVIMILFLWVSKGMCSRTFQKVYASTDEFSYEIYLSILYIYMNISQNIVVFFLFNWKSAILMWISLTFVDIYLFKKKLVNCAGIKSMYFEIKNYNESHVKKNNKKEYYDDKNIKINDVKLSKYGYIIENGYYKYNWLHVHLAGPAFIFIPSLINLILYSVSHTNVELGTLEGKILDIIYFYSILAAGYWLSYLMYSKPTRYEGWRKDHRFHFVLFCVVFSIIYWIIKVTMWTNKL